MRVKHGMNSKYHKLLLISLILSLNQCLLVNNLLSMEATSRVSKQSQRVSLSLWISKNFTNLNVKELIIQTLQIQTMNFGPHMMEDMEKINAF